MNQRTQILRIIKVLIVLTDMLILTNITVPLGIVRSCRVSQYSLDILISPFCLLDSIVLGLETMTLKQRAIKQN